MNPEAKKLIEEIKASRGWILPEQEFMVERDIEFYRRHNDKFSHFMNRENALPKKNPRASFHCRPLCPPARR